MLNERNQILKCVHTELSHVYKTLGNANKSIVVESSDCLEMAGVGNEGPQKVIEETFGSDAYGPYLGSGDDCIVYTYVKVIKLYTLNICGLSYVNYKSIKLLKKKFLYYPILANEN